MAPNLEQWETLIQEKAQKYGVPAALVRSVILQESGGNAKAKSSAGASGLMQLMPDTAKSLGVKDAFNPVQNVDAGVRYLKQNIDKFGIVGGLAAYNAGPGNVEKHGGSIPPFPETQKYVKNILTNYTQSGQNQSKPSAQSSYQSLPMDDFLAKMESEQQPQTPESKLSKLMKSLNAPSVAKPIPVGVSTTSTQAPQNLVRETPVVRDFFNEWFTKNPDALIPTQITDKIAEGLPNAAAPILPLVNFLRTGEMDPTKNKSSIQKGIEESLAQNLSGITTPQSVMIGAGMMTPAAPYIGLGMAPMMAMDAYQAGKSGVNAISEGDYQSGARDLTTAGIAGLMAYGGAKGGVNALRTDIPKIADVYRQSPRLASEYGAVNPKTTPLPESPQTLALQMDALQQGRSKAVLVTPGAQMPEIPQGMRQLKTGVGTWIFNPEQVKGYEISKSVRQGDFGNLLGHIEPKSPATNQVVSATQGGVEAKTSLVSPENVARQADALKGQFPNADIKVGGPELAQSVLQNRQPNFVENYVNEQISKRETARQSERLGAVENLKKFYAEAKSKLVDSNAPIEDLIAKSQKQGKYEMLPKYDITNQIDRTLRAPNLAGQFARDHGFEALIKEVPRLDYLDQYLIAKHAKTVQNLGKETGRNLVKDTQLIDALAPEYEPYAKQVTAYSRKLLDYSVETGLVSNGLARQLKETYPDYVPLNRIFNELEKQSSFGSGKGVASLSKQSVVQRLEGSVREIESPIASLLAKTQDAFMQGEKNKAADILVGYSNLPGNPFQLKKLKAGEAGGKSTISVLRNGVKEIWETTPEIAEAAKALNVQQLNILGKIFAAPVRIAKVGITGLNLPFVGSNIARDQIFSTITSNRSLSTSAIANPKNFVKALYEAVRHGDVYQDMVRQGGGGTSFDIARNAPQLTVENIRSQRNLGSRIKYVARHPSELFRAVENIIGRSEEFTRVQQFEGTRRALLKEGRTFQDANILAAKATRENTANFSRRGEWGTVLNAAFLYINAGIQGSRSFVRAMGRSPVQTSAKVAATILLPTAITTAWNLGDQERKNAYEDIPSYEKENNLIILPPNPTMDEKGRWNVIKVPLPPGVSNLGNPVRRTLEQHANLDPVTFGEVAKSLIGAVSPIEPEAKSLLTTLTPQALKPSLETVSNYNFFTDRPIVSKKLERLSPELQTKDTTSGTARKIGNALGVSPIKAEHFIKATFGGLGLQGLNVFDKALYKLGVIPKEQIGGQEVTEAIAARFNKAMGGELERKEFDKIRKIETQKADESYLRSKRAEELIASLKDKDPQSALQEIASIKSTDPKLYEKIKDSISEMGLGKVEKSIKNLGSEGRADYIMDKIKDMNPQESSDYLAGLVEKKLLTKAVMKEIINKKASEMMK